MENVFIQASLSNLSTCGRVDHLFTEAEFEVTLAVGVNGNDELDDLSSSVCGLRFRGELHVRFLVNCGIQGRHQLEGVTTQSMRIDCQLRRIHSSRPTSDVSWASTLAALGTVFSRIVHFSDDVPRSGFEEKGMSLDIINQC